MSSSANFESTCVVFQLFQYFSTGQKVIGNEKEN